MSGSAIKKLRSLVKMRAKQMSEKTGRPYEFVFKRLYKYAKKRHSSGLYAILENERTSSITKSIEGAIGAKGLTV